MSVNIFKDNKLQKIDGYSSVDIVANKTELDKVTTAGKVADALIVKDLNDSLTSLVETKYDDVSGKPMWKEKGADTWNFFSSEMFYLLDILSLNPVTNLDEANAMLAKCPNTILNVNTNKSSWVTSPTKHAKNYKKGDQVFLGFRSDSNSGQCAMDLSKDGINWTTVKTYTGNTSSNIIHFSYTLTEDYDDLYLRGRIHGDGTNWVWLAGYGFNYVER